MIKKLIIPAIIGLLSCGLVMGQTAKTTNLKAPEGLLCDLLNDNFPGYMKPVRTSNQQPAFSWMITDSVPGIMQAAYRIIVSDNRDAINANTGNLWDTGKVITSGSVCQIYNGNRLLPNTQYFWKVKYWDRNGCESDFSKPASFYTKNDLIPYSTERYELVENDQLPVHITRSANLVKADFGRTAFGKFKLNLRVTKKDTILIHLGEVLDATGRINRHPDGFLRYAAYPVLLNPEQQVYTIDFKPDEKNTGEDAIPIPESIGVIMQ